VRSGTSRITIIYTVQLRSQSSAAQTRQLPHVINCAVLHATWWEDVCRCSISGQLSVVHEIKGCLNGWCRSG